MLKKYIIYFLFMITIIFLFNASDESRTSLFMNASELRREAGAVDDTLVSISQDSNFSGTFLKSTNYMLSKGTYHLGIEYRSESSDNTLLVWDNGILKDSIALTPDSTYLEPTIELEKDSQEIILTVNYSGSGTLTVQSLSIIPEGRFYNDTIFLITLFIILNIIGFLIYRLRVIQNLSHSSQITLFLLFMIGIASSIPYFNGSLHWGDDLCYHLLRIEGIKDGLLDGQLPVVIYPEGLNGNGYLNCMYPNLFLYIPAFLRILGVSMVTSYKSLVILFHFLTAGITYYSVKSIYANRKAALAAALLYTLCPYRFTNFYARGAVGEALAMTFFPLLLAGLYHILTGEKKKWPLLVIGMSGLIQTHILSALLGTIFCILFGVLYIINVIAEKRFLEILKAAAFTLLLNLGFLVPFLYFYKYGNLDTTVLDWSTFSEYSLNLSGLAGTINQNSYRSLTLGIPILLLAAVSIFFLTFEYRNKYQTNKNIQFSLYIIIFGSVCTFLASSWFPGKEFMNLSIFSFLLENIQFPWRLLGPASICFIMGGCIFLYDSVFLKHYRGTICIVLAGITLLSAYRFQEEDFAYKDYTSSYTLGHTAKINGIIKGDNTIAYPYEWCPIGSNYIDPPTALTFSNDSNVEILSLERQGTTTSMTYKTTAENQIATFPIIYYNGYTAYEDNVPVKLLENPESSVAVLLNNDGNPHKLIIKYEGKRIFTFSFILSTITIIGIILFLIFKYYKKILLTQQNERNYG